MATWVFQAGHIVIDIIRSFIEPSDNVVSHINTGLICYEVKILSQRRETVVTDTVWLPVTPSATLRPLLSQGR